MTDAATKGLTAAGIIVLAAGGLALGFGPGGSAGGSGATAVPDTLAELALVETTAVTPETDGVVDGAPDGEARATFAGGCFWCMEPPYDELDGVHSTVSGFAGGEIEDPSYRQVASGATDHREVVQVTYDPRVVSYTRLLEVYWHNVDPTDGGGQFCDRGHQYSPAIFHHNAEQERLARASLERLAGALDGAAMAAGDGSAGSRSGDGEPTVAVELAPLDAFYPAEAYHQDFYEKKPDHYYSYREGCGRDRVLEQIWGAAAGH